MNGDMKSITISTKENGRKEFKLQGPWIPTDIASYDNIPTGDMPGDKVKISEEHIRKAQLIVPELLKQLIPHLNEHPNQKAVIAVCGGSGVGKSEIASLLSYYLNQMELGSYTLSGDNYPHRVPSYNDAERMRIFRTSGIKGLIIHGLYSEETKRVLLELQNSDNDYNPEYTKAYSWLAIYQSTGRDGLKNYLGTANEIDFHELSDIISRFKNGSDHIHLKRMGRAVTELWYEAVDFSNTNILIIEWTHGNSYHLQGVDLPILLNSTPKETLEHRRARNRDGGTDSPFTTMVLGIEQELLISQAIRAKLIISKNGELLTYQDYTKIMSQES
ncbi:MAG: hypothetical protein H6Q59_3383 [Firmicutes bacterium]|nr:hypothetical protein [Bacillota bacterium]